MIAPQGTLARFPLIGHYLRRGGFSALFETVNSSAKPVLRPLPCHMHSRYYLS